MVDRIEESIEAQRRVEEEKKRLEKVKDQERSKQNALEFKRVLAKDDRRLVNVQKQQKALAKVKKEQNLGGRGGKSGGNILLAKAGIKNTTTAEEIYQEGQERFKRDKEERLLDKKSRQFKVDEQKTGEQDELLGTTYKAEFERERGSGGKGQSEGADAGGGEGQQKGEQTSNPQTVLTNTPNFLLNGPEATAASQGAAPTLKLSLAELQALVKAIATGVNQKGQGIVRIELNDTVLAGASFLLKGDSHELSISVRTENQEIENLLASGSSVQDLSKMLSEEGIHLGNFVVNDTPVVR